MTHSSAFQYATTERFEIISSEAAAPANRDR